MLNQIKNICRSVSSCIEQERRYLNSPMRKMGISVISVIHDDRVVVADRTIVGRIRSYSRQVLSSVKNGQNYCWQEKI